MNVACLNQWHNVYMLQAIVDHLLVENCSQTNQAVNNCTFSIMLSRGLKTTLFASEMTMFTTALA